MNSLTQSLIALSITSVLLAGCGKKEEQVSAPTVIEQNAQDARAAEAKSEAELAVEEARKAAEAK